MSKIESPRRTYVPGQLDVHPTLSDLEGIAKRLEFNNRVICSLSLVNLAAWVISAVGSRSLTIALDPSILLMGLLAIVFLSRGSSLVRAGNALYEDVSNELQGRRVSKILAGLNPAPEEETGPESDASLVLRKFARAASMPLVPGQSGPAVYLTVNLLSILLVAFLMRLG